jgi:hypothetical protein
MKTDLEKINDGMALGVSLILTKELKGLCILLFKRGIFIGSTK